MTTAPRLFLSPSQAGELLGCSGETVRQMIRCGDLSAERRGRNYKIPRVEIERRSGVKLGPSLDGLDDRRERAELVRELRITMAKAQEILARLEA